jgi:glycosyltransferase involved in cell wall biosynthesis
VTRPERLRVAFLAGTLVQHGAEKQLAYMAESLRTAGVDVRAYTLGDGEYYEERLERAGIPVERVGAPAGRARRLVRITRALRRFRPHVVQAGHFYTNLYVALAARWSGAVALGAIRSDTHYDLASMGAMGHPSLRLPRSLLANSYAARENARRLGVSGERIHVLHNVIDPAELDGALGPRAPEFDVASPVAVLAARLVPAKRIDRFLAALALARTTAPALRGLVIGDGPERERLEAAARALGLDASAVEFRRATTDLRAVLREAQLLALTSDHEGFPNVILEAMLAGLPVVTTPAGDSGLVVEEGTTGFVVPYDDAQLLAERLARLARSPDLRAELGGNGACRALRDYTIRGLAARLLRIHGAAAEQQGRSDLLPTIGQYITGP